MNNLVSVKQSRLIVWATLTCWPALLPLAHGLRRLRMPARIKEVVAKK